MPHAFGCEQVASETGMGSGGKHSLESGLSRLGG